MPVVVVVFVFVTLSGLIVGDGRVDERLVRLISAPVPQHWSLQVLQYCSTILHLCTSKINGCPSVYLRFFLPYRYRREYSRPATTQYPGT
jgi:hypothetical protein